MFEVMLETGDAPAKIVEDRGLKQTSDTGAIEAVIAEVLAKNPNQLEQYRGGKEASVRASSVGGYDEGDGRQGQWRHHETDDGRPWCQDGSRRHGWYGRHA
ncbi:hypothetical protein LJD47_24295, partial [Escherichia coli]|nr:hypothetical protein [Escherichia coli]